MRQLVIRGFVSGDMFARVCAAFDVETRLWVEASKGEPRTLSSAVQYFASFVDEVREHSPSTFDDVCFETCSSHLQSCLSRIRMLGWSSETSAELEKKVEGALLNLTS